MMAYTGLKEVEAGKYNICLLPPHVDLSATEFPDGFLVTGQTLPKEEALECAKNVEAFMESMIADTRAIYLEYQEDDGVPHEDIKKILMEGSWTEPYHDANDDGLFCYLRFIPGNMDLERAGFPHGLALSKHHFDTQADSIPLKNKIDAIMTASYSGILDEIRDSFKSPDPSV